MVCMTLDVRLWRATITRGVLRENLCQASVMRARSHGGVGVRRVGERYGAPRRLEEGAALPRRRCRVCGSLEVIASRRFPSPLLWHCTRCDADSFTGDLPGTELYSPAYFEGDEYFSYAEDETVHHLNADRKIERLLHYGSVPRFVVEIGCAHGFFLRRIVERFPDAKCIGIDVNPDVIEAARARGGDIRFFSTSEQASFLAAVHGAPVDWLVAWDTFEHLPDADVFLRYVREIARPETLCAMTTIQAGGLVARLRGTRWRQFHPPTHVLYPTRSTFGYLGRVEGWKILTHETFGYYRSTRQYLALASSLLPRSWHAGFRRLLLKPLFGGGLYLNLYDIDLIAFQRAGAMSSYPEVAAASQ